jgi:glucose-1-phosphate cytidylyltransferase
VLNKGVIDYIDGDETVWEQRSVVELARDGQLMGYRHHGFWSCMDTLREKNYLEDLWNSGRPPWKIWSSLEPRRIALAKNGVAAEPAHDPRLGAETPHNNSLDLSISKLGHPSR